MLTEKVALSFLCLQSIRRMSKICLGWGLTYLLYLLSDITKAKITIFSGRQHRQILFNVIYYNNTSTLTTTLTTNIYLYPKLSRVWHNPFNINPNYIFKLSLLLTTVHRIKHLLKSLSTTLTSRVPRRRHIHYHYHCSLALLIYNHHNYEHFHTLLRGWIKFINMYVFSLLKLSAAPNNL